MCNKKQETQLMNNKLFTEFDVSYYSVPLYEGDSLDCYLFDSEPVHGTKQFDQDTIELLKADMIDTAG